MSKIRAPAAPLFSGWNCVPKILDLDGVRVAAAAVDDAEEVAAPERRAERATVVGRGDGCGAGFGGEGVDVIYIGFPGRFVEQRRAERGDCVPAHVGDFEPRAVGRRGRKPQDLRREDAHAAGVALLARKAHQLHADADAQDGLRERGDHRVESPLAELRHGRRGLADSREDHFVGPAQQGGIGREREFGPCAAKGVGNRPQVARGVIDDGYHRTPLLLGTV